MILNQKLILLICIIVINCSSAWVKNHKSEDKNYYYGIGSSLSIEDNFIKLATDSARRHLFENIYNLNKSNVSTNKSLILDILQNDIGYNDMITIVKKKQSDEAYHILVKMEKKKFKEYVKKEFNKLKEDKIHYLKKTNSLKNKMSELSKSAVAFLLNDLMFNSGEKHPKKLKQLKNQFNFLYQSLSVKTADKSILNRHSVVMLPGESYPLKFKLQSSENIQFGNIPIKISLFKSKATYFCKTQESGIFEHVILDFSDLVTSDGIVEIDFDRIDPNIKLLFKDQIYPLNHFSIKVRYPNFYTAYDYNLKDGYKFEGFYNKSREVNPLKQTIEEYFKQNINLNFTHHTDAEVVLKVDYKINFDKAKKLKSNDFYVAHGLLDIKLTHKLSGNLIYFKLADSIIGKSLKNIEKAKQHCVIKTQDLLVNDILPEIIQLFK